MRRTWKKAVAGTMAAAVMFTSANISPAVMNAEAKVYNLKETPTDTTKGTIDWFANDATSNIRTKMTVQYGISGKDGKADDNAKGGTATSYGSVFDENYNTAIEFKQAPIDGTAYIQLDFQDPISLSSVIFAFSNSSKCYYEQAKIQYLTDGESEWQSFNEDWVDAVNDVETSSCCFEYASETPKEHVTAIRLQNRQDWKNGSNTWIVIKEIKVIGTSEVTVGKDYPVSLMDYAAGSAQDNSSDKEGPVDYAFDDNAATYWHSEWENDNNSKYSLSDAWVSMEFEEATVIDQLTYLPRPTGATAGDILGYTIQGQTSKGGAWENIMTGTWAADKEEKTAEFPEPKRLTAVRLVPTKTNNTEGGENLYASAAKIAVRVGSEAKLAGSALSLTGKIGVNFYAQVVEDKKADAQIKISYNGTETTYPVSDQTKTTINGKEYYVVTQKVCAAEMNDEITATLMVDGEVVDEQTQSVAKYAKTVIDNQNNFSSELVALVKAMVNYGAYAQKNFDYSVDDLANKFLDAADINVESVDVADITAPAASRDMIDGKYPVEQLKLALKSGTSLKFYLNDACFAEGIDGYSFTVAKSGDEATEAEVLTSSSGSYVEYADIPAAELDDSYVLKISKDGNEVAAVTYSPLNGVVSALKTTSLSNELQNTMRALYLYNQAADAYFASIEQ